MKRHVTAEDYVIGTLAIQSLTHHHSFLAIAYFHAISRDLSNFRPATPPPPPPSMTDGIAESHNTRYRYDVGVVGGNRSTSQAKNRVVGGPLNKVAVDRHRRHAYTKGVLARD